MSPCNCDKNKINLSLIDDVLDEYAAVPGSLITILQKAQDIYGYLPTDVIKYISDKTGITPAKIMGVATFYTQFRLKPVGKYLIEKTIIETLGIHDGETTDDGLFSLKNVACLGCCSLSPVMMINGETYGSLTPDKTKKIINDIRDKECAL